MWKPSLFIIIFFAFTEKIFSIAIPYYILVIMIPQKLTKDKVTTSKIDYNFLTNAVSKFYKIAMRNNRKIKKIYSNHSSKHFFGDDMVTLNFRFKNAVYYKIGSLRTTQNHLLVERPSKYEQMELTVYGFFRKKTYVLDFTQTDERFCVERKFANADQPAFG